MVQSAQPHCILQRNRTHRPKQQCVHTYTYVHMSVSVYKEIEYQELARAIRESENSQDPSSERWRRGVVPG